MKRRSIEKIALACVALTLQLATPSVRAQTAAMTVNYADPSQITQRDPARQAAVRLQVEAIVSKYTGIPVNKIDPNARLVDLGVDSLDLVQIVMTLEYTFNIEIPDADAIKFVTVDDLVNYLLDRDCGS